jgi:HD superfamily phosphohydrolase
LYSGNIDISIINEACIARADCSSPSTCERCMQKQYHYQICYPKKCVERVIDFYRNRGKYHEFVYQHKTSVAAGYMVMDILKLADPYFLIPTERPGINLPISRAFSNARAFEMLRDSIVDNIAFSTAPELKEARELAMRYKRRRLYSKFRRPTTFEHDSLVPIL